MMLVISLFVIIRMNRRRRW